MTQWNLNDLYEGFNERYLNDLKTLKDVMDQFVSDLNQEITDDQSYLETYLTHEEKLTVLSRNLQSFASLTWATDVSNQEAPKYLAQISQIFRQATVAEVKFSRYLLNLDLDALAKDSTLIKKYLYLLKRQKESAKHLLSEAEEVMYSKLRELGSSGWSQLQSLLTSNLEVDFKDKKITLSELRNKAYDNDQSIRKEAFETELKAYETIDDAVALSLSNIKREVLVLNDLRGYQSPLDQTLFQSKMTKDILDAMIDAMSQYREKFAKYLKAKAKYLGHEGSLPFYDMFASVGSLDQSYTYDEAKDLILKAFDSYSPKLSLFAKKAFDHDWIDVEPKKGKRGGAFCSNQPQINQSRILLNFNGSLTNVLTLAHELGHGYHGDVIASNPPLFWSYPMPLAETASIFCETITNNYMLKTIDDPKARLSLLENALQRDTQVIIDILSRYFFETELFNHATGPINKHQLKSMMTNAQEKAYLDGLDPKTLNPYMWINKPHYYSAGLNFYNFPYAFGLLFGKGLYAQYQKDPNTFIASYDELLKLTTQKDVYDVAQSMGIDVSQKDFWLASLALIEKDLDEVIQLFETLK
ncbi:MAG: M3 family oligoendopeptidase [Acholeplasmataceae bacterium]